MAGRIGVALQKAITTGTSAKTLIQLVAATNHAIKVIEVGCSFHGTSNTAEPILVELIRQTDAGTMTPLTPVVGDGGIGDTLDTTANHTASAEPTGSTSVRAWTVHPQTGLIWSPHDLAGITVAAGARIGLRVTAAASTTADAYISFEE